MGVALMFDISPKFLFVKASRCGNRHEKKEWKGSGSGQWNENWFAAMIYCFAACSIVRVCLTWKGELVRDFVDVINYEKSASWDLNGMPTRPIGWLQVARNDAAMMIWITFNVSSSSCHIQPSRVEIETNSSTHFGCYLRTKTKLCSEFHFIRSLLGWQHISTR